MGNQPVLHTGHSILVRRVTGVCVRRMLGPTLDLSAGSSLSPPGAEPVESVSAAPGACAPGARKAQDTITMNQPVTEFKL